MMRICIERTLNNHKFVSFEWLNELMYYYVSILQLPTLREVSYLLK